MPTTFLKCCRHLSVTTRLWAIVLFQAIQFNISTQFSSIWPINRSLSGATTPGQSGSRSDSDDGIHFPKIQHYWNLTIRLFSVISRTLVEGWGLTLLQRCSWCILQLQPTGQFQNWSLATRSSLVSDPWHPKSFRGFLQHFYFVYSVFSCQYNALFMIKFFDYFYKESRHFHLTWWE